MDFTLTPTQKTVQENARKVAAEVMERARALDREGAFPQEILGRWAQEGFFGLALPKAYGGGGHDYLTYCLAQMELSQACPASALLVHLNHSLFGLGLAQFGSEELKRQYLPPVARGEVLACFCLTEPEAGSDPGALKTTARRAGDGWVITGTKNFVTAGDRAKVGLVTAATDPSQGAKGLSMFLVDFATTSGVRRGPVEEKVGLRGAPLNTLEFSEAWIPPKHLVGELNQGLKQALAILDGARVGAAAQAVGLGRAVLRHTLTYARERRQFGQPLTNFQAIQWKLADMATDLEAAALLTLKAAWLKDQGRPYSTLAAMAKKFATDIAMAAATEGVQILGGYGCLSAYPLERYFRDAKAGQIYEGTNEIMRLVIAREVVKGLV
jgi:alkylation response protein AidB-like acyl-CoA dehydrogenase|uniref:Acyl-CoA dehydrogenase n=1 Tax=Desulfobacca acetoxidans TaxID=60893 RepID=A0A7C5EMP1_9BACT